MCAFIFVFAGVCVCMYVCVWVSVDFNVNRIFVEWILTLEYEQRDCSLSGAHAMVGFFSLALTKWRTVISWITRETLGGRKIDRERATIRPTDRQTDSSVSRSNGPKWRVYIFSLWVSLSCLSALITEDLWQRQTKTWHICPHSLFLTLHVTVWETHDAHIHKRIGVQMLYSISMDTFYCLFYWSILLYCSIRFYCSHPFPNCLLCLSTLAWPECLSHHLRAN